MNYKALASIWGPGVITTLIGALFAVQQGITIPEMCPLPPCAAPGVKWSVIGMAALISIVGYIVKGRAVTGGSVPAPTAVEETLPVEMRTKATTFVEPSVPKT